MSTWQLQEAKARLSELVKIVETDGAQEITVHGKPVAVLLSRNEYERLSRKSESFADFMRRSPLYGLDELSLEREQTPTREIDLGS